MKNVWKQQQMSNFQNFEKAWKNIAQDYFNIWLQQSNEW